MKYLILLTLLVSVCLGFEAQAQTAGTAAGRAAGTVASVDASAKQIAIKTDKGETVSVAVTGRSFLRRLPPGEADMKKAVPITITDIAAGDPVVASYQAGPDQKTLEARTILIRTKSDVAQMREKQIEDWQKRGIVGNIASIDAAAKTVTVKAGSRVTTAQVSEKTKLLRYAPDSAEIEDARPGTFADMKTGDEIHVLGNKSAEGTTIAAEEIVFGSFKQIAATIQTVDPQAGELKVKDLAVKKAPPVTIKITPDTTLKKLPPQLAAIWARRYGPAAQARGGQQPAGQAAETGRGGGFGPGGQGGMRAAGGADIKQILDRLPVTTLSELKPGDAIMVSTTEGRDSTHLTAIMILAGVEPVLTAAPNSTRDIMSGWNLGGGGEGEGN